MKIHFAISIAMDSKKLGMGVCVWYRSKIIYFLTTWRSAKTEKRKI